MRSLNHIFIIAIGAVCALQACGAGGPEDLELQESALGEAMISEDGAIKEPALAHPPALVVDKHGQRWRRQRAVVPVADPPAHQPPRAPRSTPKARPDLLAMTDEELAEKLRPISLFQGYEYTLEQPPIEQARQLKARLRGEAPGSDELRGGEPSERTEGQPLEALGTSKILIGSDGRQQYRNNTDYPFRSMLWITNASQTQGGTAQLIGASTAVSVAHVFHSGAGWYSTRRWAAGVDSQDANPYPYGLYDGCYWVTIPAAWDGSDEYYDFAVVEFSNMFPTCNLYPGNTVGWLGWKNGYVPNGSEAGAVIGYPGEGTCAGGSCNWPQLWGMNATGMDEDGWNIDHYADTSGGQSGAGLYIIIDNKRYVIGAHQAGYSNPFDDWNEARRIEGLFYTFIKDYSAL
jgi:V8-like Glu-specific endopeptidase